MQRNKQTGQQNQQGRHENPLPQEISQSEKEQASNAHEQAEEDMENDPEITAHSPNDDLDEAESARLGEDKTDLV